jgi:hypothetical protein
MMLFTINRASNSTNKPTDDAFKKEISGTEQWCIEIGSLESLISLSELVRDGIILTAGDAEKGDPPDICVYDAYIE